MFLRRIVIVFVFISIGSCTRLPLEVFQHQPTEHYLHHHRLHNSNNGNNFHLKKITDLSTVKVLYQVGVSKSKPNNIYYKTNIYTM